MDEITHKNVMAIKQHSEDTRKLYRELEAKTNTIDTLLTRIDMLEQQVRAMQVKVFSGGSTS
jgi:polyhydroxyalkanoate synthesis regulator phasin